MKKIIAIAMVAIVMPFVMGATISPWTYSHTFPYDENHNIPVEYMDFDMTDELLAQATVYVDGDLLVENGETNEDFPGDWSEWQEDKDASAHYTEESESEAYVKVFLYDANEVIMSHNFDDEKTITLQVPIETAGIVDYIFHYAGQAIAGGIAVFGALFADDGILSIFYDTEDGLTILGGLLILGFGITLVNYGFRLVSKLIRMR